MKVIWITGLSGSGKSTLAKEIAARLKTKGEPVIYLDGDELREIFFSDNQKNNSHDYKSRLNISKQYSMLCRMLALQNFTVVIATISLFHEVHEWNRKNLPGYFEIYLKTPLDELKKRDPKGIYRKYEAGEIKNVAGLDLFIEEPKKPDWLVEFDPKKSVAFLAEIFFELQKRR